MNYDENNIIVECSEDNIIIECQEEDMIVELKDCVTFWNSILGEPSSNQKLVNYLNSLLETKQDLVYFVVATEADKNNIPNKKTGTIAFVKATKNLYIYYSEEGSQSEWIMLIRDLSNYYTKSETDSLLALKANIADVYSKIEADARFATLAQLDTKVTKNNMILGNTKTKITYDYKGLVTNGEDLVESDIPSIHLNKISDVSATVTEVNYLQGTTSNIQQQLNSKATPSDIKDGKLTIKKNGSTISEFTANQSSDVTADISVPTKTSDLYNDSGFIDKTVNNLDNYTLTYNMNVLLNQKQPNLTSDNAGTGISITGSGSNVKISSTQSSVEWGNITGDIQEQTDLQQEFGTKQPNLTSENAGTGISITGSGSSVVISNTQTSAEWGNITGTLSNQTDLQDALDNKVTKNADITGATHTKITYDSKGLVTAGTDLTESDIPNLHLSKITDVTASAQEVNYLTGTTSNIQSQINSKLNITDVINNITTTTANQALSANMGKELQDQINNLKQRGRYLSIWNCTTGLATTEPTVNPYTYKAGDYFIVGIVGATNYRPNGATYDKDVPSTTVETETVIVNDTYYFDGTSWSLLHTAQPTVAFSTLAGSPYDNANLTTALNAKVTKNNDITGATKTKITYDSKGLVTAGTDLTASDIPNLTLSKITDVTASATELNYVDGATSNIQTQLNSKAVPSDIKDGILTIQKNGTNVATFSANQSTAQTANIIVPTAANDISYTNPDYPTVGAALDKLLYVMPSVSISGGGNYEIGATVNTVNLSWTWNKNISSQSLNQGIGSLATNIRSYSYTTPTTSNKTFTITGSDGTNTKSASTSITFYYKRYWGVSANTTLTDAEILALSQELSGNRAQTRTFDCSGGKYFYFVILASYCTGISFKVGGLSFSDVNVVTRNVTNAQGHTASYNIYRPNNIQTGSAINVVVS